MGIVKISGLYGYENVKSFYYVDSEGNILSDAKGELKSLKQLEKTGGYLNACLMTENNGKRYARVNRLVALAFVENDSIDKKIYVNHIDEDRKNNKKENLEWVTPKQNNLHSLALKYYCYDFLGNLVKVYSHSRESEKDGFNQGHVCACARGEERSHKKHIFSNTELTKEEVVQRLSKPFYREDKRRW